MSSVLIFAACKHHFIDSIGKHAQVLILWKRSSSTALKMMPSLMSTAAESAWKALIPRRIVIENWSVGREVARAKRVLVFLENHFEGKFLNYTIIILYLQAQLALDSCDNIYHFSGECT